VEDENGRKSAYRIVGPDEAEPGAGRISFQSPLGQALMRKRAGDVVSVRRPAGEIEVTVLVVRYD